MSHRCGGNSPPRWPGPRSGPARHRAAWHIPPTFAAINLSRGRSASSSARRSDHRGASGAQRDQLPPDVLDQPIDRGLRNAGLLPDHGTHRHGLDRVHGVQQLCAGRGRRQAHCWQRRRACLRSRSRRARSTRRPPTPAARHAARSDEHLRPQRQIVERPRATQESHVRLLPAPAVSGRRRRRGRCSPRPSRRSSPSAGPSR